MGACLRCPHPRSPAQSWVTKPHPVLVPAESTQFLSSPPTGLRWGDKELMNEEPRQSWSQKGDTASY